MSGNKLSVQLVAVAGSREGATFYVAPDERLSFGRTEAADHSFPEDGHMSGVHFEIKNQGEFAEVRDCGSTNKTWLNNQSVSDGRLREGDRIRAGTTVLTVEFVHRATNAPPVDRGQTFVPQQVSPTARPAPTPQPETPADLSSEGPAIHHLDRYVGEVDRGAESKDAGEPATPSQRNPRTPPAVNNPFESADFEAIDPPPADESLFTASEKVCGRPQTPFSDSVDLSAAYPRVKDTPELPQKVPEYGLFGRRTSAEAADGFSIVLHSVAQSWSIQLIAHFLKIRNAPPKTCSFFPILTWIDGSTEITNSPVRADWDQFSSDPDTLRLLPRLCRADACIAFVGKSSDQVSEQIARMLQLGIEGFSEPGGFLACCWPSSLVTLLASKGPTIGHTLFDEYISGVLWCSPSDPKLIVSFANPEFAYDLLERRFEKLDSFPSF